jgi:hypothetical protein
MKKAMITNARSDTPTAIPITIGLETVDTEAATQLSAAVHETTRVVPAARAQAPALAVITYV